MAINEYNLTDEKKMFSGSSCTTVAGAVRTFIDMKQGDSLVVPPHLLNPLLRVIETMDMHCIVDSDMNHSKDRIYRVFKKITKNTLNHHLYKNTVQVVYNKNPFYGGTGNLE